jgi:hypothetical protein
MFAPVVSQLAPGAPEIGTVSFDLLAISLDFCFIRCDLFRACATLQIAAELAPVVVKLFRVSMELAPVPTPFDSVVPKLLAVLPKFFAILANFLALRKRRPRKDQRSGYQPGSQHTFEIAHSYASFSVRLCGLRSLDAGRSGRFTGC